MAARLDGEQRWHCPACGLEDVTDTRGPHTRMHSCRAKFGLTLPMIPWGVKAKIDVREREDYVGKENVQLSADGRPIMSVVITRDEGQDCVVFAPSASASGEASSYGLD